MKSKGPKVQRSKRPAGRFVGSLVTAAVLLSSVGAIALAPPALAQLKVTEAEARQLALLLGAPQEPAHPFNLRPADVTVIMSTSRKKYDGTYTFSEVARTCGEVPKELNFSGVPAFIVHLYPDSGVGEVQDVTFDSKVLVGGVTKTDKFHLSVSVKSPAIGSPAAYVLDTLQPGMQGTATVTTPSLGTVRLKVDGVNDRGETVNLTLVCKPRR